MKPSPTIPTRIMANRFLDGTTRSVRDRGFWRYSAAARGTTRPRASAGSTYHSIMTDPRSAARHHPEVILPDPGVRIPRFDWKSSSRGWTIGRRAAYLETHSEAI